VFNFEDGTIANQFSMAPEKWQHQHQPFGAQSEEAAGLGVHKHRIKTPTGAETDDSINNADNGAGSTAIHWKRQPIRVLSHRESSESMRQGQSQSQSHNQGLDQGSVASVSASATASVGVSTKTQRDMRRRQQQKELEREVPYVSHAALDESQRRLVIINRDQEVEFWNFTTGVKANKVTPQVPTSVSGLIQGVSFRLTSLSHELIGSAVLSGKRRFLFLGTDASFVCCMLETHAIDDEPTYCLMKNSALQEQKLLQLQGLGHGGSTSSDATDVDLVSVITEEDFDLRKLSLNALSSQVDDSVAVSDVYFEGDVEVAEIAVAAGGRPMRAQKQKQKRKHFLQRKRSSVVWVRSVGKGRVAIGYSDGALLFWELDQAQVVFEIQVAETGLVLDAMHRLGLRLLP